MSLRCTYVNCLKGQIMYLNCIVIEGKTQHVVELAFNNKTGGRESLSRARLTAAPHRISHYQRGTPDRIRTGIVL